MATGRFRDLLRIVGESLLNAKASSLTFYQKGAWALHILREQIGGEAFKTSIKSYLEKYKFQNVSNEDFLNEVRAASETDISAFEKDWLQQSAFRCISILVKITIYKKLL